jgi:hypothetical protein
VFPAGVTVPTLRWMARNPISISSGAARGTELIGRRREMRAGVAVPLAPIHRRAGHREIRRDEPGDDRRALDAQANGFFQVQFEISRQQRL